MSLGAASAGEVEGSVDGSGGPPPLGREPEQQAFRLALERAKGGAGATLLLVGPGGIGKTCLLGWASQEARRGGFTVRWGTGLKEALSPFFLFEQVFREGAAPATGSTVPTSSPLTPLDAGGANLVVVEEERPSSFYDLLASAARASSTLLLGRDRPLALPPELARTPGFQHRWFSRVEGEGRLSPTHLDLVGDLMEQHLRSHHGGVGAIEGLEYLVSQNSFGGVLRLLQFLRDVAVETGGRLVVSMRPSALRPKDRKLLESEGEVRVPPSPPSAGGGPGGAHETGRIVGANTAETLLRMIRRLELAAQESPQLLVLDDLQWADPRSVVALGFLVRNLRDLPVLVLAGMRDDEVQVDTEEGTSLSDILDALGREGLLERRELRGLPEGEARRLLERSLGGSIAEAGEEASLWRGLLENAAGNPYFLAEYARQLQDDQRVTLHAGRAELRHPTPFLTSPGGRASSPEPQIPAGLRRLLLRRTQSLSQAELELLQVGGIAGSEFPLAPVASVLQRSPEELQATAEGLERNHRFLQRRPRQDGEVVWAFAQPIAWEVVTSEVPAERRREVALGLARAWTDRRPNELDTIARLFHVAQEAQEGTPWVRKALERALEARTPELAATLLGWLGELRRSRGGRAAESELLAREVHEEIEGCLRLDFRGGPRLADRSLLALSAEPLPPALHLEAASARCWTMLDFDRDGAGFWLEETRKAVEASKDRLPPLLVARLGATEAVLSIKKGEWKLGLGSAERVLALPPGPEVDRWRASAASSSGWCLVQLERYDEARKVLESGKRLAESRGLLDTAAALTNTLAYLALREGRHRDVLEALETCVELSQRTGNLRSGIVYQANLAGVLASAGASTRAEELYRRTLEIATRFQFAAQELDSRVGLTELLLRERRFDEAEGELRRSLELEKEIHTDEHSLECALAQAQVLAGRGRLPEAIARLEELERQGGCHDAMYLTNYHLVRANLFELAGSGVEALREVESALEAGHRSGDRFDEARSLLGASWLLRRQGRGAEADERQAGAGEVYRELGFDPPLPEELMFPGPGLPSAPSEKASPPAPVDAAGGKGISP